MFCDTLKLLQYIYICFAILCFIFEQVLLFQEALFKDWFEWDLLKLTKHQLQLMGRQNF